MSSSAAVIEAEIKLKAAVTAAQAQRCEDAKVEIKRLRREGAELRKQLRPMVRQIKDAETERLKLHSQLVQARDMIGFYNTPLNPLDFPTDEEVAEHTAHASSWKQRQQELLVLHRAAVERESVRVQAIALQKRLQEIYFEIRNWAAVAEGRRPGEVGEGGAFTVGEDLLGHSDRRFA